MPNLKLLVLAAPLACTTLPARAVDFQGYETGNKLLAICQFPAIYELSDCIAYVAGSADQAKLHVQGQPQRFCMPEGVSLGQQRDIVLGYLKQHPEKRQQPSGALIWQAMAEAFPCSRQK